MWWYYEAVMWRLAMADRQVKAGEAGRAAWHSVHAGRLFTEMELKANYDDFFIKAQRTRDAQADGGRSTRDRKSVVRGKRVSVRVDLGGRRIIKKKKTNKYVKDKKMT